MGADQTSMFAGRPDEDPHRFDHRREVKRRKERTGQIVTAHVALDCAERAAVLLEAYVVQLVALGRPVSKLYDAGDLQQVADALRHAIANQRARL